MNKLKKVGAAASTALVSGAAAAETSGGGDLESIASAVDFSSVTPALMTVGSAIVGVLVTFAGMKWVLSAVRRA